jgi:hypothetical protein
MLNLFGSSEHCDKELLSRHTTSFEVMNFAWSGKKETWVYIVICHHMLLKVYIALEEHDIPSPNDQISKSISAGLTLRYRFIFVKLRRSCPVHIFVCI